MTEIDKLIDEYVERRFDESAYSCGEEHGPYVDGALTLKPLLVEALELHTRLWLLHNQNSHQKISLVTKDKIEEFLKSLKERLGE